MNYKRKFSRVKKKKLNKTYVQTPTVRFEEPFQVFRGVTHGPRVESGTEW